MNLIVMVILRVASCFFCSSSLLSTVGTGICSGSDFESKFDSIKRSSSLPRMIFEVGESSLVEEDSQVYGN
jgi:hypothetical protein